MRPTVFLFAALWISLLLVAGAFKAGGAFRSLSGRSGPGALWASSDPGEEPCVKEFSLNALDYRLNIYDFRAERLGTSRHVDHKFREYVGDLLFNGTEFLVLENERYTGTFLDLGQERKPDDEFSLFYSLRIYKRVFQTRQYPFHDRYKPYPGIDSRGFFTTREPSTAAKVALSHLYALRLHHRTTVGDERVFLLRVIDLVPGVRVSVLWRELENQKEA